VKKTLSKQELLKFLGLEDVPVKRLELKADCEGPAVLTVELLLVDPAEGGETTNMHNREYRTHDPKLTVECRPCLP
jgi:hypothetical protein